MFPARPFACLYAARDVDFPLWLRTTHCLMQTKIKLPSHSPVHSTYIRHKWYVLLSITARTRIVRLNTLARWNYMALFRPN